MKKYVDAAAILRICEELRHNEYDYLTAWKAQEHIFRREEEIARELEKLLKDDEDAVECER